MGGRCFWLSVLFCAGLGTACDDDTAGATGAASVSGAGAAGAMSSSADGGGADDASHTPSSSASDVGQDAAAGDSPAAGEPGQPGSGGTTTDAGRDSGGLGGDAGGGAVVDSSAFDFPPPSSETVCWDRDDSVVLGQEYCPSRACFEREQLFEVVAPDGMAYTCQPADEPCETHIHTFGIEDEQRLVWLQYRVDPFWFIAMFDAAVLDEPLRFDSFAKHFVAARVNLDLTTDFDTILPTYAVTRAGLGHSGHPEGHARVVSFEGGMLRIQLDAPATHGTTRFDTPTHLCASLAVIDTCEFERCTYASSEYYGHGESVRLLVDVTAPVDIGT